MFRIGQRWWGSSGVSSCLTLLLGEEWIRYPSRKTIPSENKQDGINFASTHRHGIFFAVTRVGREVLHLDYPDLFKSFPGRKAFPLSRKLCPDYIELLLDSYLFTWLQLHQSLLSSQSSCMFKPSSSKTFQDSSRHLSRTYTLSVLAVPITPPFTVYVCVAVSVVITFIALYARWKCFLSQGSAARGKRAGKGGCGSQRDAGRLAG